MNDKKELYISIDIEATGLDPKFDEITEIGAVAFIDTGEILDRFQDFLKISIEIPFKISKLTRITNDLLDKYGSEPIDALSNLRSWIYSFIEEGYDVSIVAHNAQFDYSFLKRDFTKFGMDFDFVFHDTLKMSRKLIPTLQRHTLGTLCRAFQIENEGHHRADHDAEVLAKIFLKLLASMRIKSLTFADFETKKKGASA